MDVLIESTAEFEADLKHFHPDKKVSVLQSVDDLASLVRTSELALESILNTDVAKTLQQPALLPMPDGYESSLYQWEATEGLMLIVSIDDDPIFEQRILTFYRAVEANRAGKAYEAIATSLYQALSQSDPDMVQVA